MNDQAQVTGNPYVGPRTFASNQRHLFFGREEEARDLLSRVVSERLLLFYAQSGAGKSSLINARLTPALQDEGFAVLPVGRVSGELLKRAGAVGNIFAFNLMLSLDQGKGDPARLAQVTLSEFLANLTSDDGEIWSYDPKMAESLIAGAGSGPAQPFVLIIDQFEEIITSHPDHWDKREAFFQQLNQALLDDPNLWVVLTLREDYVAALDPFAPLLFNRLRPRYYMERMEKNGALEAIKEPARLGGRTFAPGAAEHLVDDLRQIRVPGTDETIPGQYVEPVQLQVVCFELWENLEKETGERGDALITLDDLAHEGNVDQALTQFYEETVALALTDPAAEGIRERRLRRWFETELITPAGTRGFVNQGPETTGELALPNDVVRVLQQRFLVRTEIRAGGVWVELVHDRFVDPILESNEAWFGQHLSVLQRQALLWDREERPDGLLLRGGALEEAELWAQTQGGSLQEHEEAYLAASRRTAQEEVNKERRRLVLFLAGVSVVAILALLALSQALIQRAEAQELAELAKAERDFALSEVLVAATARSETALQQAEAESQRATAEAASTLAVEALAALEANLVFALTAQAPNDLPATSGQASVTPTPGEGQPQVEGEADSEDAQSGGLTTSTPDSNATLQAQLALVKENQEALLNPATQTPSPTPDLGPHWFEIGKTSLGNPIPAVRFGAGPNKFLFVGGIHAGSAPASVTIAENLVTHFSDNPGEVPSASTIYIVPSLNLDSEPAIGQFEGRTNARGVDLNRNWDCNWVRNASWRGETYPNSGGQAPFSEPETKALRNFVMAERPKLVAFWDARVTSGLVALGQCEAAAATVRLSFAASELYGKAAGYRVDDYETFTGTTINGDAANWLDFQGIPSFFVMLDGYEEPDWENNLNGVRAVLDSLGG